MLVMSWSVVLFTICSVYMACDFNKSKKLRKVIKNDARVAIGITEQKKA